MHSNISLTPRQQLNQLLDTISERRAAIQDKYDEIVRKELHAIDCEFRDERQALERQCRELDKQAEIERIEAARSATLGGVAIGGKVVEWKSKYRFSTDMVLTGKVGIVELCTHDSEFGENVSSYSRPNIGSLFVRILKKDGTPSLKHAGRYAIDDGLPWGWYPEGVEPK